MFDVFKSAWFGNKTPAHYGTPAHSAKQGLVLNLKAMAYALEHNTMDVDMVEVCIKKSFEGYRFWNK